MRPEGKGGVMRGLASFLLFAAFFYLMMLFGCGAHTVHGDQREHGGHGSGVGTGGTAVKDPVCGMQVQSGQGWLIFERRATAFSFLISEFTCTT